MATQTPNSPCVFLITAPGLEVAEALAEKLVRSGLVACVNIVPGLLSVYIWQGNLCRDQEVLLVCKSHMDRIDAIEAVLKTDHPYEVPELIALPVVAGSAAYLDFVSRSISALT